MELINNPGKSPLEHDNHVGTLLSWRKILTNLDTVSGIRESLDSLGNQECHLSIRSISNYIIFLLFNKAIIFYFTNIVMSICSDHIFDSAPNSNSDTHYITDSDSDPNSDSAFSSGLDSDDIFITFLNLFLILFQFVILYLFLIQFIFL